MSDDTTYTSYPRGELLVAKPRDSTFEGSNYLLMWKFHITIAKPSAKDLTVYVNARTGDIVSAFSDVDSGTYGTGYVTPFYDAYSSIRTWRCDACSQWRLASDKAITTFDGNVATVLKDPDNIWNNPDNRRPMAAIHWATEQAWLYFYDRHGRVGSAPNNVSGVELRNFGNWIEQDLRYAYYKRDGNLDIIRVGPLINGQYGLTSPIALDILSHEYAHAFIRRNPNLNSYNVDCEAGALNEGFADIFGLLSERRIRGNGHGWRIGEDVTFNNPSMRDFVQPNSASTPQQPYYFCQPGYWDFTNGNKHKNAGILTHWFYLLSQGTSTGVSSLNSVQGIGIEAADDISFITMMWWLWNNVGFSDARNQSVTVAIDKYGWCSQQHISTVRAWAAVGVGTTATGCKPWVFTGPKVLHTDDLSSSQFKIFSTEPLPPFLHRDSISWLIPSEWSVTFNFDETNFVIESTSSSESKEVTVYLHFDDHIDTLTHIVHFVDCEECDPPMERGNYSPRENLQENKRADKINVYPNPVDDGMVRVDLPYFANEDNTVEIYSMDGRLVRRSVISKANPSINVDDLRSGVYLFNIRGNEYSDNVRVLILNQN